MNYWVEAAWKLCRKDEEKFCHWVGLATDSGYGIVRRVALSIAGPRTVLDRVQPHWNAAYNHGMLRCDSGGDGEARLRLDDSPWVASAPCQLRLAEVFRRVLSISRGSHAHLELSVPRAGARGRYCRSVRK